MIGSIVDIEYIDSGGMIQWIKVKVDRLDKSSGNYIGTQVRTLLSDPHISGEIIFWKYDKDEDGFDLFYGEKFVL